MKYICELCGWIFDENVGHEPQKVRPGTAFRDLPEDFECPCCACGKEAFDPVTSKEKK